MISNENDHLHDSNHGLCRDLMYAPFRASCGLRSTLGCIILLLFVVEVFTGLLLMTVYSPSTTTAWASVWYIQSQMPMGWFIRGLHHFAADALIIVIPIYLIKMLLSGACKPPREFLWWSVLIMLAITMAAALSGALLPWDQLGYWGTNVRLNIMALTPVIGNTLKTLLMGGSELGHLTLTRFYTLHTIILPGMFLLILCAMVKRQTVKPHAHENPQHKEKHGTFRNAIVSLLFLGGLMFFTRYMYYSVDTVMLNAPAHPTAANYPARPEWYNLFLFQWLKWFKQPAMEVVGAIFLPGVFALLLLLVPSFHRWLPNRLAGKFGSSFVLILLIGVVGFTAASVYEDRNPSDETIATIHQLQQQGQPLNESQNKLLQVRQFNQQKIQARRNAARAFELASVNGISPEGPLALLRNDSVSQGPLLFSQNCAACHRFDGHDGLGNTPSEPATSSDLAGYASRSWIRGLLNNPMDEKYFGLMKKPNGKPAHTRMSKWTTMMVEDIEDDDRQSLMKNYDAVAAYLEDESLNPERWSSITVDTPDDRLAHDDPHQRTILRGRKFFMTVCNECHRYEGEQSGTFTAPEMRGYGSVEWLELMIAEPGNEMRYRSKGRGRAQMPPFIDKLTPQQIKLIAQWLHDVRN